jgi:hypothetical protein
MYTIEEYPEKQLCYITSEKMTTKITIKKSSDGFIFFDVKFDKGPVPYELSGKYSSMPKAKEAVLSYLNNRKETESARRENFAKEREERKKLKEEGV